MEKEIEKKENNLPVIKDNFEVDVLKAYPPELKEALEENLTPEKAEKISRKLGRIKHGAFAEVPLLCKGNDCPYAGICPLVEAEIAPYQLDSTERSRCPIEIAAITSWTQAWVDALEVDVEDFSEIYLIRDLVEAEIMQMRANKDLSLNGFIREVVVKVDPITQEAYVNYDTSIPLEVKMRFKTLTYKILDKFIATRESKLKWRLKSEDIKNKRYQKILDAIRSGDIDAAPLAEAARKLDEEEG